MIKNLILSGGSTKALSILGVFEYLDEHKLLDETITFVGTSAGSIIAFLMVVGFSIKEMKKYVIEELLTSSICSLSLEEILDLGILSSYGLDSGNNFMNFLKKTLYMKYQQHDITFSELTKRCGKNLVVCAANITTEETEYLSVDTTPDLSVLLAIRMSISIPLIFSPIEYNDCYYVDGGIYESFPISYINQFKDPLKDTLGINICYPISNTLQASKKPSFFDYISQLMNTIVTKANAHHKISDKIKIINIDFQDSTVFSSFSFETMSFSINEATILEFIQKGYDTTRIHFGLQT